MISVKYGALCVRCQAIRGSRTSHQVDGDLWGTKHSARPWVVLVAYSTRGSSRLPRQRVSVRHHYVGVNRRQQKPLGNEAVGEGW